MAAVGQLFEAIVVDAAPDPEYPGFLRVKIPDLTGGDDYPHLVGPMFPGWVAGGWQSIPAAKTPEGEPTRLIVHYGGENTIRWFATTQVMPSIASNQGLAAGARSPDGRHYVNIHNTRGITLGVQTDGETTYSYIAIKPDGSIQFQAGQNVTKFGSDQIFLMSSDSHALDLSTNGAILMNGDGKTFVSLTGGVASLRGDNVVLAGATITMGDGNVLPTERLLKTNSFFPALGGALTEMVAAIGVPCPTATALVAALSASLSAGDPYLSKRIFGS